ncbi:MAG: hypothetical protein IJW77_16640 [Clostridia bacterium]|nr:hypothetical protein [Clostridia bacterium]
MDQRLFDILHDREDNYIFPFYWQHGDHQDRIPEQIERIYQSGCRAFCVESRPHPEFCQDGWWADMDIILEEAQKRSMQVWILDDDFFPTGHAAGWITNKYPGLRQWTLIEEHIDTIGPAVQQSVMCDNNPDNRLLGVYAYRRHLGYSETCTYEGIDLTQQVCGNYLYWDIPDGVWRIFFYYQSRKGGTDGYIDTINRESVRVLIDAVYETHYAHYASYFGNTLAGFFSDEPSFRNNVYKQQRFDNGYYDAKIGKHALALPWNQRVLEKMTEKLGYNPLPHLNLLWYEDDCHGDDQAELRYAYMDTVTAMYSECFTGQIADWCHMHGVEYIGHTLEDMNCHMRDGISHYFRALEKQDMSGIDVVLHQILPGLEDYLHTAICAQGVAGGDFYHYILAKLGASLAHITPSMQGRSMCEIFGAYGWGETSAMMKYLIDHMLVRGINHFVPHAFNTRFPDNDGPPHFGVEGYDPNFEAFSALMRYANKAAHLLSDTVHIANAAILYHMDGEWASRFDHAMNMQPIAVCLYDAHIDYDIVPADVLSAESVCSGKLHIHKEQFDCLIVPYADHMPQKHLDRLQCMQRQGLPVFYINAMPENAAFQGEVLSLETLVPTLRRRGMTDVIVPQEKPKLRVYHCKRNDYDLYMFFNEDYYHDFDETVLLPSIGTYVRLDLLNDSVTQDCTADGYVRLQLAGNASLILVFDPDANVLPMAEMLEEVEVCQPDYTLALASHQDLQTFREVGSYSGFFNVTGPNAFPNFSGKMRYRFSISLQHWADRICLNLGIVGQNAVLSVNGKPCGIRITSPYRFDITDAVMLGENCIEVTVSNTLAQAVRDKYSYYLQLPPSGILGDIVLEYYHFPKDDCENAMYTDHRRK